MEHVIKRFLAELLGIFGFGDLGGTMYCYGFISCAMGYGSKYYSLWTLVAIGIAVGVKYALHLNFQKRNFWRRLGFATETQSFTKTKAGLPRMKVRYPRLGWGNKEKTILNIRGWNELKTEENFRNALPVISQRYNMRCVDVMLETEKSWKTFFITRKTMQIIIDRLPKALPYCPPKVLKYSTIWLGRNTRGEEVIIDTKPMAGLAIFGQTGAGKSMLARNIIRSYTESTPKTKVVLICPKDGSDYSDILPPNTEVINPFDEGGLQRFNDFLDEVQEKYEKTTKMIKESTALHADELREKGIELPLEKILLICDEAPRYLSSEETDRERRKLCEALAAKMNRWLALYRSAGIFCVLINQRSQADSWLINRTNLVTVISARQESSMSQRLFSSDVACDPSLREGKWCLLNQAEKAEKQFQYFRCGFEKPQKIQKKKFEQQDDKKEIEKIEKEETRSTALQLSQTEKAQDTKENLDDIIRMLLEDREFEVSKAVWKKIPPEIQKQILAKRKTTA